MLDGVSYRADAFLIFDDLSNPILIARLYQRRPSDLEIRIEQSDVGVSADALLLPSAINENNDPFHLSVSQKAQAAHAQPVLCLNGVQSGFAKAARLCPPIFVWIGHKIGVEI